MCNRCTVSTVFKKHFNNVNISIPFDLRLGKLSRVMEGGLAFLQLPRLVRTTHNAHPTPPPPELMGWMGWESTRYTVACLQAVWGCFCRGKRGVRDRRRHLGRARKSVDSKLSSCGNESIVFLSTHVSRHIDDKFGDRFGLHSEQNSYQFIKLSVMPGADGVMQRRLAILQMQYKT